MPFSTIFDGFEEEVHITLKGELDAIAASLFKQLIERAMEHKPRRLILFMAELTFIASAALRVLVFAKQKMGKDVGIYVIGSQGPILNTLRMSGFDRSIYIQETYFKPE